MPVDNDIECLHLVCHCLLMECRLVIILNFKCQHKGETALMQVGFEVLKLVVMSVAIFWAIVLCSPTPVL
jgi:hypothetical protein